MPATNFKEEENNNLNFNLSKDKDLANSESIDIIPMVGFKSFLAPYTLAPYHSV